MLEEAWTVKKPSESGPKRATGTLDGKSGLTLMSLIGLVAINALSLLWSRFGKLAKMTDPYSYGFICLAIVALPYIMINARSWMLNWASPTEESAKRSGLLTPITILLVLVNLGLYGLNGYWTYQERSINPTSALLLATSSGLIFLFAPKGMRKLARSTWSFCIQSFKELREVRFNNLQQVIVISLAVIIALLIFVGVVLFFNFIIKNLLALILS